MCFALLLLQQIKQTSGLLKEKNPVTERGGIFFGSIASVFLIGLLLFLTSQNLRSEFDPLLCDGRDLDCFDGDLSFFVENDRRWLAWKLIGEYLGPFRDVDILRIGRSCAVAKFD